MKKIMMILAALVLLLSAAYAEENDLLARIRQKGEIVVATEGAWAPWTYHDENDQLVGFDVEVAHGVAAKLGVTAKFVETEWDGIFAGLDAGRYDMAANGVEGLGAMGDGLADVAQTDNAHLLAGERRRDGARLEGPAAGANLTVA